MTELKLKPCPFCGSNDIDYGICGGTLKGFDYVQCENCGATMHAIHKGNYIAAECKWNTRPDVQEIKHGKNITEEHPVDAFICSECGFEMCDISAYNREEELCYEYELRYCPNCGAKMDREE